MPPASMTGDFGLTTLALGEDDVDVAVLDVTQLADTSSPACRYLTPEEQEEYDRLRHPLRRREWLGARICLKSMLGRRGLIGDPRECAIVKDARGRPSLSFAVRVASTVYDCSLSHKGRFACAGVSSAADIRLGVDIEEVSPRLLRLASAFASDRDALIPSHRPDERLTILWALKEACTKVVGGGLGIALRDVTCEETAEGRHRVTTAEGLPLRGRHLMHAGYVVALCVGPVERRPG